MPNSEIIAILRGIETHECSQIFQLLVENSISRIEIPINSPNPFESISKMVEQFGETADIGAGTILNVDDVKMAYSVGANYIVSPNCDEFVIKSALDLGIDVYPGVFSPTDMFNAIKWGASNLKLFPATILGLDYFKAVKEVLPKDIKVWAVGGIKPEDFIIWKNAGIYGFGIGSCLYKAGDSIGEIKAKIANFRAQIT